MQKNIELETPAAPNFIRAKGGTKMFSIKEFSEYELREIGHEWTEELIKKAEINSGREEIKIC